MPRPSLLLASSSPYRADCLRRLGLDFSQAAPDIDETSFPGEAPIALVERLADQKARALAGDWPNHLIIGSDQVAALDQDILTKPHTPERAREQLQRCSGRTVRFFTGLSLHNSQTGHSHVLHETCDVTFRGLTEQEIACYVARENPLDCAGSFRMEGLGIALFTRIDCRDPNTLIGLPMMALCDLLREEGMNPLE